ncbi:MAG: exo-alpha-sialidase [Bacteroidetes bacterium]|nr:exo-alpha-sialidase [Bacteroidota bacterium]MBS1930591.1 exo-alpha-sialidase [Bacteroidota bacterium]
MTTKLFFISIFMIFATGSITAQTVTVTQTQLPAGKGQTNQRILLMNITNSGGTLNTVTITMNGTTATSDVTKISVISTGTNNRFYSTQTVFGTTTSVGAGNIAITGSNALTNGSNNYFWITYDVAAGATEGNVLDATCVSVRIGATTTTVNSSPAGSSLLILQHSVVFKSGDQVTDGGVPTASTYFRIPAIITAANGDIITATDARFSSASDLPSKADIIIRRSTDKGVTWLTSQTIADLGVSTGAGDASLILDKTNGNIICLFASNSGLAASTPSSPIRVRMCKSTDNGATWTAPVDLTNQIYGSGCADATRKNWYAVWIASGRQTQLNSGRLVAVAGVRATSASTINNTIIYSDDHGTTWSVVNTLTNTNPGGVDGFTGDESKVVELNNGNLMMSSRTSIAGGRKFRTSTNGGATWSSPITQASLNDPRCDGDFVRYSSTLTGENMNILLHTLPNNTASRQNLTVFASTDEGTTFSTSKAIFPGLAQYSSITRLKDGTLGMYYEMADPGSPFEMYFARFSLNLLGISGFIPLPVNFFSFEGKLLSTGQVQLDWKAQTDNAFSHFEVERFTTGANFQVIGQVAKENPFTFIDNNPATGNNYYRIKGVDIDGSAKYSKVININNNASAISMSIHPNPVSDQLTLRLKTGNAGNVNIQITDMAGHVVLNKKYTVNPGDNEMALNVKTWQAELYFIKATDNNNQLLSVQKFIKQ